MKASAYCADGTITSIETEGEDFPVLISVVGRLFVLRAYVLGFTDESSREAAYAEAAPALGRFSEA